MLRFAREGIVVNVPPDFAGAIGIVCTASQKEAEGKNEKRPEPKGDAGEESL